MRKGEGREKWAKGETKMEEAKGEEEGKRRERRGRLDGKRKTEIENRRERGDWIERERGK